VSAQDAYYSARLTIGGDLVVNPRRAVLDGKLTVRFKPNSEDLKIMDSWFAAARTPGEKFKREVLVEFEKRKRFRLHEAYPSIRRIVRDQIERERVEFVVRFTGKEKLS